ncbi:MAG: ThuA domain-containing protein [Daejeonella sp.]
METILSTTQKSLQQPFASNKKVLSFLAFVVCCFIISLSSLRLHEPQSSQPGANSVFSLVQQEEVIRPVQVFLPGFTVKEIPLDLSNLNAVRYGPDGRLYGLAYDGHIYVLTDTDGDGVEDKAEYWWDKNLFVAPVAMAVTAEGIYVTSLNKLSLIRDVDKDGKAETEEIIATDWEKPGKYTGNSAGGVDAMGVAKDEQGNIFFALGTADFTNGYLIDSLGKSHYDIKSHRGTVLKLAPGSKKAEIYCTGTRFPVAMAFNQEGDLFASEQEGATWLPNGNPYDELLHLEKDRHYGFPPRHPEYLPDVIDEPSVYDYKPQHQSTCGLNFNLPVNGGPVFGPAFWKGDAIMSGYSRGKIYRTKLIKTPSGYVADNAIIASVSSLTVDACVSPKGDLVVATHAGFPDWGFGPQAKGKLYKIIYTNKEVPMPVSIWLPKPDQVKISFDKPVNRGYLAGLADKIKIEYGEYVEAGGQFEVLRPGYKAVERQQSFSVQSLKVNAAELSGDGRTLTLNTFTHTAPVTYAITLPAFTEDKKSAKSISQAPVIELAYKLQGTAVTWQGDSKGDKWNGWLPHLDLIVSKTLLEPTAGASNFNEILNKPGKITWKSKLDLWNMLRPNTQPESTLEYTPAAEDVNLIFRSSEPLAFIAAGASVSQSVAKNKLYETVLTFKDVMKKAYDIEVSMKTSAKATVFEVFYSTKEDPRPRALQLHRFFVPWVEDIYNHEVSHAKENPELAGGNWERGKQLFFGGAICGNCHTFGGRGKSIGPDLSNLVFRDYNSVLRDIQDPSAAINPDYLAHTVTLKNKETLTGMLSYKTDSMIVRDIAGNRTIIATKNVASTKAISNSLMPPGLDKMLGEQKLKDLMTYMLTSIKPTTYSRNFGLSQIRKTEEVRAVLGKENSETAIKQTPKLLKILWVSGPKDHGEDEHDYPLQQKRWKELLSLADQVNITQANKWPTQAQFDDADVVVFFWKYAQFSEDNGKQLDSFLQRGGGAVYLHFAVDGTDNPQALANRIGLAWKKGTSKFRHGFLTLKFTGEEHPITTGFSETMFRDESYWNLVKGTKEINVLATANEDGSDRPMIWTATQGRGRIFVNILGHYNWTFDDPLFRILVLRGIAWTGNQPANRLEDLATIGARVSK